jgi:GT2 family glycosyltransferase
MSEALSPPGKQIICVLGMHRGGTSLITRLVNVLGAYLGPEEHLMRPNQFNPKGYWENQQIVDLNDAILSRLGGTWRDPPPFPKGWEGSSRLGDLRQQARALLQQDFGMAACWGWKDPRTCLTLPFWQQLLPPLRYVVCLRNPADVARSLKLAQDIPTEKAMDLWHMYTKAAVDYSAGHSRILLFYEDFMDDPPIQLQRLAEFFSGSEGKAPKITLDAMHAVMAEELHHHRTSVEDVVDHASLAFPAKSLYLVLRLITISNREGRVSAVINTFNRYSFEAQETSKEQVKQIAEAESRVAELLERIGTLERETEALRKDLATRNVVERQMNEVRNTLSLLVRQLIAGNSLAGNVVTSRKPGGVPLEPSLYLRLIRDIREVVLALVPRGETIAVVTKGDNDLLKFADRVAWHFPQTTGGAYAGHHPADSDAAICHLEELSSRGASYLVFPETALWWLEHYDGFRRHLDRQYRRIHDGKPCIIYDLSRVNWLRRWYRRTRDSLLRLAARSDSKKLRVQENLSQAKDTAGQVSRNDSAVAGASNPTDYPSWASRCEALRYNPDKAHAAIANFTRQPVISIVMPVFNTNREYLCKAIDSVRKQYYSKWELCICDDASTSDCVPQVLEEYAKADPRIKVTRAEKNGGISRASNAALALATGEFVGLLDHDDELPPDALYEVASVFQEVEVDLIYSDEDKLDESGQRCDPFFKPAWSPDLLMSCMYTSHFSVYRRSLVESVGRFREGYEGSQDYDLALRVTEKTDKVIHIPRILYHWRKMPGSAAASTEAKPYAYDAGRRALQDALARRGVAGEVTREGASGLYRVRRNIQNGAKVSIIIPTRDRVDLLRRCLESIEALTSGSDFEILVVDNGSSDLEALQYLGSIRHRVIRDDGAFNYSRLNNSAAKQACGDYLLLLNNDVEILDGEWLSAMLEHAQRPEVGAVGAKLLYPDGRIQHAGTILGIGSIAGHSHRFLEHATDTGYSNFTNIVRNYSAVTAACLMVRRNVYDEIGGLNEADLAVSFNDVDFCLRLRERGYLVVYSPYARLCHHESASRGFNVALEEQAYMKCRWRQCLLNDPYYNPNLTLAKENFEIDLSKPEAFTCVLSSELSNQDTGPLLKGRRIEQEFVSPDDRLCAVAVAFGSYGRKGARGILHFRLEDMSTHTPSVNLDADASMIGDNQYFLFAFDPIRFSADRKFSFCIEFESTGEAPLSVWRSTETAAAVGPWFEGGKPMPGTLAFKVFCLRRFRRA